jgi:hypothetical protein
MLSTCVAAYRIHTHGVVGSNLVKYDSFFHAAGMLLFYVTQIITESMFCIFRKFITIHHLWFSS